MFLVTQSFPTLCDPMDRAAWKATVHGDSPGKNAGVGGHALFQGIFPTQGSNLGLQHCKQILYHLSHQGSPDKGFKNRSVRPIRYQTTCSANMA